jgi:N-acetylglucosamine-6-phosphate deacetylase
VTGRAAPRPILVEGATVLGATEPEALLLAGGRIAARGGDAVAGGGRGARRFRGEGLFMAPGFIDLQLNGAAGHDLSADPGSVWDVAATIAAHGVTAFLPTIVTAPPSVAETAARVLAGGPPPGWRGATPLGLHLEGPFLNPGRSGAHDRAHLRAPDPALAAGWSAATGVRIVTLAPELPGALELVRTLAGRGVVVAAGHSLATAEEAAAGFDAGIRYVTHLFNAMPPLGHRAPGLAGAALSDGRVIVGLIPDGVHVDPLVVDLTWRVAGADRLSIVTDAMAALGMPPGRYPLGGVDVEVGDDGAQLPDGRLAGSVLSLDAGLRNLVAYTGAPAAVAADAVTRVPAALLGERDRGALAVGAVADVVVLDAGLEVVATIARGVAIHGDDDGDGERWA